MAESHSLFEESPGVAGAVGQNYQWIEHHACLRRQPVLPMLRVTVVSGAGAGMKNVSNEANSAFG